MMRKMLLTMVAASALGGCAGSAGTHGRCDGTSLCPIVIYEKFPGVFATYPDHISAKAVGKTTLLWTFANPSGYKFMASSSTGRPDSVELIGGSAVKEGLGPCFITSDSAVPLSIQSEGGYLRCEITVGSTFDYAYRVHFHSWDGLMAYTVDPTIVTTGSNDGGSKASIGIRATATVPVKVGQDATVPATGGVLVVWDAGTDSVFKPLGSSVVFSNANGDYQPPCYVASDATGQSTSSTPTRFYACAFFNPPALDYTATYFSTITGDQTAVGKIVPR